MTAEKWLNVEFVAPDELAAWLKLRKSEGYNLVGAEQVSEKIIKHFPFFFFFFARP